MPRYRVRRGQQFGPGGQYSAGTVLELTESEAKGFDDKLERLSDEVDHSDSSQPAGSAFGLQNDLNVEAPAELKIIPPETEDVKKLAKPKSQRKHKTEQ